MACNDKTASGRGVCASTKVLEFLLFLFSLWAGVMIYMTPYLLKDHPPLLYKMLLKSLPGWESGLVVIVLCMLQPLGLFLCRKTPEERVSEAAIQLSNYYIVGINLRCLISLLQVALWAFLAYAYTMTYLESSQTTLASGMCYIIAGCASCTSYCVNRERARLQVRHGMRVSGLNKSLKDNCGKPKMN